MHLLRRVELHLRHTGTSATRFGRDVACDPRLVFDLRKGREPRAPLHVRITAFLDERDHDMGERRCSR